MPTCAPGLWSGANVTMPHKRLAVEEMDALSSGAERAVSVNTVVVEGSRLTGHSTDIDGIQQVWQEAALPRDVPVLVLGAGGAAAAALIAIDTDEVFVSSRHFEDAARLAAAIDVGVRPVPWGTAVAGAVVVNATPLGMAGDSLPLDIVEESAGLLDMAYARRATPAVLTADRAGVPLCNRHGSAAGPGDRLIHSLDRPGSANGSDAGRSAKGSSDRLAPPKLL